MSSTVGMPMRPLPLELALCAVFIGPISCKGRDAPPPEVNPAFTALEVCRRLPVVECTGDSLEGGGGQNVFRKRSPVRFACQRGSPSYR